MKKIILVFAIFSFLLSCGNEQTNESATPSKPAAPQINQSSPNILYSWFEDGTAKTSMKIDEIPDKFKKEVRVQDLTLPPEKRNPEWIFLANLTQKDKAGNFEIKTIQRQKYEQKRHPETKAKRKALSPEAAPSNADVIMYATPYCPYCKKARNWLLDQKIKFREIDISENENAQMQLAQKGQAQGVSTSGVPIFEVNGHLVPGFDPSTILKAMKSPPRKHHAAKNSPTPPPAPSNSSLTI